MAARRRARKRRKQASSFSEEKEAKRLLSSCCPQAFCSLAARSLAASGIKSLFASFSSEKEDSCLSVRRARFFFSHPRSQAPIYRLTRRMKGSDPSGQALFACAARDTGPTE
jgi:hypothetical protein